VGVITLFGAKGSPGVTTTALLAAALWPRPAVLVDADSDGGDVALRLPRADGAAMDRSKGLLTLLPLARRELAAHVVAEHAQTVLGGVEVVAGLAGPEQVNAVGPLWGSLASAFRSIQDADVIIDVGRLHSQSVQLPLAQESDLVLCVLRLSVTGVIHSRERLRAMQPHLRSTTGRKPRVGIIVIAPPGAERDVVSVAGSITGAVPGTEMFGHLSLDEAGARLFLGEPVSRPERTMLVRSGRKVVDTVAASLPVSPLPTAPVPPTDTAEALNGQILGGDQVDADGMPSRRSIRKKQPRRGGTGRR
jgi:MinD-like ATPase involved in chromosome partitioning or flagellar assembly